MPQLRNTSTGIVVTCSEQVAATLGSDWEPTKPPKRRTSRRRKSTPKTKDDD